jgi:hypothetical protein
MMVNRTRLRNGLILIQNVDLSGQVWRSVGCHSDRYLYNPDIVKKKGNYD